MIGKEVSHYRIIDKIGNGGMGEVFLAEDTKLDRRVALKFLPRHLTEDKEARLRFEREAKAAAALNHPNIVTVHEIGEHDGQIYIAMEYVDGKTLKEIISVGTGRVPGRGQALSLPITPHPLPIPQVIDIATQITSGLAAAHEKGIVHRDVKPQNILIDKDNRVKILDFGLAKLKGVSSLTKEASTLGTIHYMSPEQTMGKDVDHRSDIWSLGVVIYEMLTGDVPFKGDYEQAVIYSILNDKPEPLSEVDRGIPPALAETLARCLEKSPNDRIQSARDLIQALRVIKPENGDAKPTGITASRRRLRALGLSLLGIVVLVTAGLLILRLKPTTPSAQVTRPLKIVVLPFENLGAPEDAYFAAGMADEITSRLANIQGLGVISRTSAIGYDRKGKTIKQIGYDLGVDYVLEGSVRWERGSGRESRVRITPQLIRVADDTHIWSDRYERVLADVFAIQSDVAESTVKAMGVAMLPREQTALKEVPTNDLEAYDLYLRGKEMEARGNARADTEGALLMYQAAVAHDPRFAQAFAGIAKMNLLMRWEYYDRSQERLAKAREAAERARELRPDLPETHNALGFYHYWGMLNYPQALVEFAAALKINPSSVEALEGIGFVLRRQGKWEEAVEKLSKAAELDPKNANRLFNFGFACALAGRYADAEGAYARTQTLNPHWAQVYSERSWVQLLWHGDADKAQAILEEASRVAGLTDDAGYLTEIQYLVALARRDYQGELRRLQAETRDAIDNQDGYWPIPLLIGQVHRLVGQHDLAYPSFETARLELEQRIRQHPDDHRLHSSLGIAYAGLGRKDDAVREARLGCELMPPSKDALRAIQHIEDLAVVYTMVNRKREAIAALDDLLLRSGWFTAFVLRLDSRWDPLRGDPRFQSLLRKYII